MRTTSRLLAAVSSNTSNYLTPRTPTGLTGILTHPHPRPQLLWIYSQTLDKLSRLPASSVYRQSTEALTRHRLNIIESQQPEGFEKWQKHVEDILPKLESGEMKALGDIKRLQVAGKPFLFQRVTELNVDDREAEWDGDKYIGEMGEGSRSPAIRAKQLRSMEQGQAQTEAMQGERILNEPPLTREQIGDIEERIGAGLIEEVVIVAERERDLVDIMLENEVWDELTEQPEPGQWDYFQRDTNVMSTQSP